MKTEPELKNKVIKAINADNEAKRLKITFEDGTLGQLTFKQIEMSYGMFYLPDMQATFPPIGEAPVGGMVGPQVVHNTQQKSSGVIYNNSNQFNNSCTLPIYFETEAEMD